jgi:hypothetical protein
METLWLHRSSISDAGCAILEAIPLLRSLHLETDQSLSTQALNALGSLEQLENLWIDAPGLGDAEWSGLSQLTKLRRLTLKNADITGDGLKYFAATPLDALNLYDCRISSTALGHLNGTTIPLWLVLNGSNITDDHIESLEQVTNLIFVTFHGTQVTAERCDAFAKSHRGVEVFDATSKRHYYAIGETATDDALQSLETSERKATE